MAARSIYRYGAKRPVAGICRKMLLLRGKHVLPPINQEFLTSIHLFTIGYVQYALRVRVAIRD